MSSSEHGWEPGHEARTPGSDDWGDSDSSTPSPPGSWGLADDSWSDNGRPPGAPRDSWGNSDEIWDPPAPDPERVPRWLVSWPAVIVGFVLFIIPGLVLLWLRPQTSTRLKSAVTLAVVGLLVIGAVRVSPDLGAQPTAGAGAAVAPSATPSQTPTDRQTSTPPSMPSDQLSASPSAGDQNPTSASTAPPTSQAPASTERGVVTRIVDGDTLDVAGYGRIRVIGIDTPERGECGFDSATLALAALVDGREVTLTPGAQDDQDRYDRLLRYVDVEGLDAGLRLIEDGWAIARYDSRDGYGPHTREETYVAADALSEDLGCYE